MLPKENRVFLQKIAALTKTEEITPVVARRIVLAILFHWQTKCYPKLATTSIYGAKKYSEDSRIKDLATWISQQSFLEGSFWLSTAYALLVGKEHQSKYAMFFTPPLLANRLIDNLIAGGASLIEHVWKDPACGGGAFLTPVAVRMVKTLRAKKSSSREIVSTIAAKLIGTDVDPTLTHLSENFIYMAMYEELSDSEYFPKLQISVKDSLLPLPPEAKIADVIVCNPPYRKMARIEVDRYRENFSDVIEGQPNLYGLFMHQCMSMIKANGIIGLLTPTSFLSGQNFSKLRKHLSNICWLRQLDLVNQNEGIFLGVEQQLAISILAIKEQCEKQARRTKIFIFENKRFSKIGSFQCCNDGSVWIVPRSKSDAQLLKEIGKNQFRLRDYGYLARIGAYVFYRDKRETFAQLPMKGGNEKIVPLVWSSDITTCGTLVHGRTNKKEKRDTFINMSDPNHRSVISRQCVALQRVTSSDQERRLIGAPVPTDLLTKHGGIVGENHVIFLEKISDAALISPMMLAAILNSSIVDRLFRCISGAVNVSIFELNQLPLPCPNLISPLLAENKISIENAVRSAFVECRKG